MSALICDGCHQPIRNDEWRIYWGWRFTGTAAYPPRAGDTTHMTEECQRAYAARRLYGPHWSIRRLAAHYKVSRYRISKWLSNEPLAVRS